MSYKVVDFIENQLPEFVKDDYETFKEFIEAYYEFLQHDEYSPLSTVHDHEKNIDIDETLDEFVDFFKNQFMASIPKDVLADEQLLIKHIKQFYGTKGTEQSYEFLFRVLYDKPLSFYYPKDDILKASDGKWVKETSLYVSNYDGVNVFDYELQNIFGEESGASANIDIVRAYQEGKYYVYEMVLNSFIGEFLPDEKIYVQGDEGKEYIGYIYGIVSSIDVLDPGEDYKVGDNVQIYDYTGNGINATASVGSIIPSNTITDFNIINGGHGYRTGDPLIFDESNTPGFGAEAYVSSISPETSEEINTDLIGDHQNVVLDTIDDVVIEDYLTLETFLLGSIDEITLVEGGENYTVMPIVDVGQETPTYGIEPGYGADIVPISDAIGEVNRIDVLNPGVGYIEDDVYPIADLSGSGNGMATANVNVSGGPWINEGYFLNDDGMLSHLKFIQDNFYYQTYSYVTKVAESVNTYREVVKDITHPSGYKMFGEVSMETAVETEQAESFKLARTLSEIVKLHQTVIGAQTSIANIVNTSNLEITFSTSLVVKDIILIQDYKNEEISYYENMVLENFAGFNQEKSPFARRSIVVNEDVSSVSAESSTFSSVLTTETA